MMKKTVIVGVSMLGMIAAQTAWAGGDHGHGGHGHEMKMTMQMHGDGDMANHKAFKKEVSIDGFDVSFHIMKAMKSMGDGGSHSVMIKVEQEGGVLTDIAVNSKVTHPNGASESKMMMRMGDWYMTRYDLDHPGKHQLMILFKTRDGAKHFGGITFSTP